MQNQERNQNQIGEEGKEKEEVLKDKHEEKYEQLMKEGKEVLDSLHLINASKEGLFEGVKPREAEPVIIIKSPEQAEEKDKMVSEQEEPENQGECSSRNHPQNQSKNEGEHSLHMNKKSSKVFIGCNCVKSRCTKNYCECFTQGRKCTQLCKCTGCENQGDNNKRARSSEAPEGERTCNCKRSNCLKKYCECFNSGLKCTPNCKCQECKNCEDPFNDQDAEEGKSELRKARSADQLQEINRKLDQIAKLVPKESQECIMSFLEYWLS